MQLRDNDLAACGPGKCQICLVLARSYRVLCPDHRPSPGAPRSHRAHVAVMNRLNPAPVRQADSGANRLAAHSRGALQQVEPRL